MKVLKFETLKGRVVISTSASFVVQFWNAGRWNHYNAFPCDRYGDALASERECKKLKFSATRIVFYS